MYLCGRTVEMNDEGRSNARKVNDTVVVMPRTD